MKSKAKLASSIGLIFVGCGEFGRGNMTRHSQVQCIQGTKRYYADLVHQVMAAHCLVPIERVYGTVFENILGEKISTKPVDVVKPFTWVDRDGNRIKK